MANTTKVPTTLDDVFRTLEHQRSLHPTWVVLDESVVDAATVKLVKRFTGVERFTVQIQNLTQTASSVKLTGTCAELFGNKDLAVQVLFLEGDAFAGQAILFALTTTIAGPWFAAAPIEELGASLCSELELRASTVVLTSGAYLDTDLGVMTVPGLNLKGTHSVATSSGPLAQVLPHDTALELHGTIIRVSGHYGVAFKSQAGLRPAFSLLDVTPPTITNASVAIESRFVGEDDTYLDRVRVDGVATLGAALTPVTARLELLSSAPDWRLTFLSSGDAPDNATLLALANIQTTLAYLPSAWVAPTKLRLAEYALIFDAYGDERRTDIALQLDLVGTWDDVPVLQQIRELVIGLEIGRRELGPGQLQSSFSILVQGLVSIRSTEVRLLFGMRNLHRWHVEVQPQDGLTLPPLSDIAALVGNLAWEKSLPAGVQPEAMLKLDTLAVDLDSSQPKVQLEAVTVGLSMTGEWSILPGYLTLQVDKLALVVANPLDATIGVTGEFAAKVRLGASTLVPVSVSKPNLNAGWSINIAADTVVELPGVADLLKLANAESSLQYLPSAVTSLRDFVISDVFFGFAAKTNELQSFAFSIFQKEDADGWHLIQDKLFVTDLAVRLVCTVQSTPAQTKELTADGHFAGTLHVLRVAIPVLAQKPNAEDGWDLRIAADTRVELPTLADIFSVLDASATFDQLPKAIKALPGFYISDVEIRLKPASSDVQRYAFKVGTTNEWVLLEDSSPLGKLALGKIDVDLKVDKTTKPIEVTGAFGGSVTLLGKELTLSAARKLVSSPWELTLASATPISFDNPLTALAQWMLPADLLALVPNAFLPFPEGFELSALNLRFNLSAEQLEQVGFELLNRAPWTAIDPYVVVDNVQVGSTISAISAPGGPAFTAAITGTIQVGTAKLQLDAQRAKADTAAKWTFAGKLVDQVSLDFRQLVTAVHLDRVLTFPTDLPLPTLQLTSAAVKLVPEDGLFDFSATSKLGFSTAFADVSLPFLNLGGTLHIERDAKGEYQTSGALLADLNFCGIDTRVSLLLGKTNTIFSAALVKADGLAKQPNLAQIADGLMLKPDGTSNSTPWDTTTTGMTGLTLSHGFLFYNHTQKHFFVYGTLQGLGSLVFVAKPRGENAWGYLAAVTIGTDFKFARVFGGLAALDTYLTVKSAGLLIASGVAQTTEVMDAVSNIDAFPLKPPDFSAPLALQQLPTKAIDNGIYFYAQLDLASSSLFSGLLQLGKVGGKDSILISALVSKQSSDDPKVAAIRNTRFEADLPDITLADTLRLTHTDAYPGIHLSYLATEEAQFNLTGRIVLQAFDKEYSFDGELRVDAQQLRATLALVSGRDPKTGTTTDAKQTTIERPFALPGITLQGLSLSLVRHFTGRAGTEMTLIGKVLFGPKPVSDTDGASALVTTQIVLDQGKPVLLEATLDARLDIGQFLARCATGDAKQWPTTFIDLAFEKGSRIYYCASPDRAGYELGLHVQATLQLTLVSTVNLNLLLSVSERGVTGAVVKEEPVNLLFVDLAGTDLSGGVYTGGPRFVLNTEKGNSQFGFVSGLNFLGKGFVESSVYIARDGDLTRVNGKLELAEPMPMFGKANIGFEYKRSRAGDGEFHIDWPAFDWLKGLVDIIDELQKLIEAMPGDCATFARVAAEHALQTTYTIKPSVAVVGTALRFSIGIDVAIDVFASSPDKRDGYKLTNISLEGFSFDIAATARFDDLPALISEKLVEGMKNWIANLHKDTWHLVLLLVFALGKKAVEVAGAMACRGMIDMFVVTVVEAVASAVAAVASLGFAGMIMAGLAALATALGGSKPDDPPPPKAPKLPNLQFNGSLLEIGWDDSGATTYEVLFGTSGTSTFTLPDIKGTHATVDVSKLTLNRNINAQVVAVAASGKAASPTATLFLPAAPTALGVDFAEPVLTLRWADVTPAQYVLDHVVAISSQGQSLNPAPEVQLSGASAALRGEALNRGGSFQASVQTRCKDAVSPMSAPVLFSLGVLAAPQGLTIGTHAGQVNASWQGDATMEYILEVNGVALPPSRGLTAVLSGPELRDNSTLTARVKAHAALATGTFCDPVNITLLFLTTPAAPELEEEGGGVLVRWTVDPRAVNEDLEMIVNGQSTRMDGFHNASVLLRDRAIVPGASVDVRVRAHAANAVSEWSATSTIVLAKADVIDPSTLQANGIYRTARTLRDKSPNTPVNELCATLHTAFPNAPLVQMAIALGRVSVNLDDATKALATVFTRPDASTLAYALKTGYPEQNLVSYATDLRARLDASAPRFEHSGPIALNLRAYSPTSDATQLAVILQRVYPIETDYNARGEPVGIEAVAAKLFVAALKAASFTKQETQDATQTLLPNLETLDSDFLPTLLSQLFPD